MPNAISVMHETFARWTLSGVVSAVGTDDAYRGGVQYEAALEADADIGETWLDDLARGRSIALRVRNQPSASTELLDENGDVLLTETGDALLTEFGPYTSVMLGTVVGMVVVVEVVTTVTYDNGAQDQFSRTQQLTCIGRERGPGVVTLLLQDLEDKRLQTLFPPRTYTTKDFPALLSADAGRAAPRVFGLAVKVPAIQIEAGPVQWTYLFYVGHVGSGLAIYRGKTPADARLVTSGYVINTIVTPFTARVVRFFTEQRDFDGSLLQIFVDVADTPSPFNAATVLDEVLTSAGIAVNAASLAAAEAFCTAQGLLVDCGFYDAQRTAKAIAEDLLWVMRATLSRNASGEYVITCDGVGASVATYDEDAGDDIEVVSVSEPSRPTTVAIAYRPSPRDPKELQYTLTRAVTDGVLGAEPPRQMPYVRSHEVADRCVSYRAARAGEPRLRARIYRNNHNLGDVLTISSTELGLSESLWRVREISHIVGGIEIVATPYSAALTTYTAGELPADASDAYQPDYSSTPPTAPTSFRITATATALQGDGTLVSRVSADAIPPAVNWASIVLAAIHDTTGEIVMATAADVGGGRYGATLTGLRPGEVYQLKVWAVNSFGVLGVVEGTFNATAIGGGAAVTTFTAAGYATLPADATGMAAAQGTGKLINATWNAVTTANLREYVIERSVNGGGFAEVWRGQARNYIDRAVSYGSSYVYRVKARDTYGNLSANWATSASVPLATGTVVGGISGNDIGASTVAPSNRTSTSSASGLYNLTTGGMTAPFLFAHNLGQIPLATITTSSASHLATINLLDSFDVGGVVMYAATKTSNKSVFATTVNSVAGDPHTHNIPVHDHILDGAPVFDSTGTLTIYFW